MTAAPPPAPGGYVFDNDSPHSARHHASLEGALDPLTLGHLREAGVTPGMDCLEIGAGAGSVSHALLRLVTPGGTVTATDIKPGRIAPAPGLTVLAHDVVTDPLPEAAYDLVVARLVLQHLPERQAVLDRLVRALRPGGLLQIDEFDAGHEPCLLAPSPQDARLYERFTTARTDLMRAAGGDPTWGRRAPAALREAGLTGLRIRPHVLVRAPGTPALGLQLHHLDHLAPRLLDAGFTPAELDRLGALMRDPGFAAATGVLYSVQGRRPARTPLPTPRSEAT
ncbi:methyltransferase domain-containing protein [Streptomyces sp. R302]|uniref:class I SAM-dependent methyltransferase n=1 Tax=unclassified Streptomyces TaxID=2593676 RepID=UPI00145CA150|nr:MULTISPECIES: methyltransferase [unclassified Streptomyces]NML54613.1 methyltransferase domain-containing protein [Streptomyces sp. R301]NML82590.1 methyltransferase domain-containing protein [Streptomyces sp. R302]